MITVEWDVYNGLENDSWELTTAEIDDFIASLVADLSVVRPLLSIPPSLGGRGYIIRLTGLHATVLGLLGVPAEFRITPLPLDLSYLTLPLLDPIAPGDSEVLELGGEEVPDENDLPPDDGGGGGQSVALTAALAACSLAYTSWDDFSFWNGSRRNTNNCYCYAANFATNNWSHPGRKGGAPITSASAYASRPTATQMINALKADGWKTTCSGSSLRIVSVIGKVTFDHTYAPAWDYHFYRKNLNGSTARWCHKPGRGAATNRDASGNYISSPSTADRSKYYPATSGNPVGYTINYNQVVGTLYSPAGTRSVTIR